MITYKEQFDKLTRAYIENKVEPYNSCACFIGNLLGTGNWSTFRYPGECVGDGYMTGMGGYIYDSRYYDIFVAPALKVIEVNGHGMYFPEEILDMENNFLRIIADGTHSCKWHDERRYDPKYEDALFMAFESTLEMLKQIHIRKGESIEETPKFEKRVLSV